MRLIIKAQFLDLNHQRTECAKLQATIIADLDSFDYHFIFNVFLCLAFFLNQVRESPWETKRLQTDAVKMHNRPASALSCSHSDQFFKEKFCSVNF